MIRIIIKETHSKIDYSKATAKEKAKSEEILIEKFQAKDKSQEFNPMVRKGFVDPTVSFYIKERQIIPSGFIPYVRVYYRKNDIEFEQLDLRRFPKVNQDFLDQKIIKLKDKTARDYQHDAVSAAVKNKGGILKLATGLGKSMIAAMLCRAYDKDKIMFLFDSVDLVLQTREDLVKDYGFSPKEIGVIQAENFEDDKRITLLSIQSYEKAFHILPEVKVIIADECHKTGRNPTSEKIIYCCQNAAVKIGLSATPDLIENPVEQLRLYGTLGPIIYRKEIVEGIEEGNLSKINVHIYEVKCDPIPVEGNYADMYEWKKVKAGEDQAYIDAGYEIVTKKEKKFARRFIKAGDETNLYVNNKFRNEMIARIVRKHDRVLLLFRRDAHGENLKALIPEAVLIGGKSSQKERNAAKKYLKENKKAIVIASHIWATGINIPEIETYANAAAGASAILATQKLGRATRKSDATEKEKAVAIDFLDTFSGISSRQSWKRIKTYKERLKLPVKYIKEEV